MPEASVEVMPLAERMRRGNLFAEGCLSREVMRHVTSSWGVLILIALQDGTMRVSELRRRVGGVSERMLAQTLRLLEHDRLLTRKSHPRRPTTYRIRPHHPRARGGGEGSGARRLGGGKRVTNAGYAIESVTACADGSATYSAAVPNCRCHWAFHVHTRSPV